MESKANIIVGLPITYILNYYLIGTFLKNPLANKEHWAYLTMSIIFTIVSILRTYTLRRIFNRVGNKK
jgi:hypothetical protein